MYPYIDLSVRPSQGRSQVHIIFRIMLKTLRVYKNCNTCEQRIIIIIVVVVVVVVVATLLLFYSMSAY